MKMRVWYAAVLTVWLDVYKRQVQNGGLAAGSKKIFFKLLRLGKLDKLFAHQIIKGNFPFPPPAQLQNFIYGCMTNDNLAKGIECVPVSYTHLDVYKRQP